MLSYILNKVSQTLLLGEELAKCVMKNSLTSQAKIIYLTGDLGVGKTTLARGFMRHFGIRKVKSPTYALVESYPLEKITIHHFDCYRLVYAQELEEIGIRDYQSPHSICLFEWPEKAKNIIAKPHLNIKLNIYNNEHYINISTHHPNAKNILKCLQIKNNSFASK